MGLPKMELMVVKAIRRLQDVRGSTAREINDFLSKEFGVPVSGIKKSVKVALKRALNYGILKNKNGHYIYNSELITHDPIEDAELVGKSFRKKRASRSRKRKVARGPKRQSSSRKRIQPKRPGKLNLKSPAVTALSRARNGSRSNGSSNASINKTTFDDKRRGSQQNDSQEELNY